MAEETAGNTITNVSQVRDEVSIIAAEIKLLVQDGDLSRARERFADIVKHEQRRACRIAYRILRNDADADEAVQDAFMKVFSCISSFREEIPFEAWFIKILINRCLDCLKVRHRHARWLVVPKADIESGRNGLEAIASSAPSPEDLLVSCERRRCLAAAVGILRGRQRTVFLLRHFNRLSSREVGMMTGLNESTIRVHFFQAVRKLRAHLEGNPAVSYSR